MPKERKPKKNPKKDDLPTVATPTPATPTPGPSSGVSTAVASHVLWVRFSPDTQDNGDRPSPRPRVDPLDPRNYQPRTGARMRRLTGPPEPGQHPLRRRPERTEPLGDSGLTGASSRNAQELVAQFPEEDRRPGMGGALLVGDMVIPHSSMKGHESPNYHLVVQQVLDETPDDQRGRGHGRCAEVGAISDYLYNRDPNQEWTAERARYHFEQIGAATTAHRPPHDTPTDACPSCQYLTRKLGIRWYNPRGPRPSQPS